MMMIEIENVRMAKVTIKPTSKPKRIAAKGGWEIILRPYSGMSKWVGFWVNRKKRGGSSDPYQNGVSDRHLVSFNVVGGMVDGAVGWRELRRRHPDVASWFLETVEDRFVLGGAINGE